MRTRTKAHTLMVVAALPLAALLGGCSRLIRVNIVNAYPHLVTVSDSETWQGQTRHSDIGTILPRQQAEFHLDRTVSARLDMRGPDGNLLRQVRLTQEQLETAYWRHDPTTLQVTVSPERAVIVDVSDAQVSSQRIATMVLGLIVAVSVLLWVLRRRRVRPASPHEAAL